MAGRVEVALGVVGPGLVGRALIAQLHKQAGVLEELRTSLRVVGIANSRRMLLVEPQQHLNTATWQEDLHQAEASDLAAFQRRLRKHANPVIVDCTASDAVPATYAAWLAEGGHVVTPNKRLGAGPLDRYHAVSSACLEHGSKFFYEATVGAGLPILSTLQGLLRTGDAVQKVEGVFSGTLSYIFNSFSPERPFSSVVAEARAAGYTEPDPRDDLSGMDVARKVAILARECGLALELADVAVESLVPQSLRAAESAEAFMSGLREFDGEMAAKASEAAAAGCKLCYVGSVDLAAGTCSVALQAVPRDSAFAQLSGSDNIVSFTTQRYQRQPLTVRGPGAGAEVTAAGVFGDIVLLARGLGARC